MNLARLKSLVIARVNNRLIEYINGPGVPDPLRVLCPTFPWWTARAAGKFEHFVIHFCETHNIYRQYCGVLLRRALDSLREREPNCLPPPGPRDPGRILSIIYSPGIRGPSPRSRSSPSITACN